MIGAECQGEAQVAWILRACCGPTCFECLASGYAACYSQSIQPMQKTNFPNVLTKERQSRMGEDSKMAVRAVETGERKDRVLIVEDEDNARKGYEQLLQRWGYDVLGVASAEEVLAKFASYQPDTLIADVELPGMNGLDLLKQLGSDLHEVPAIIITGKGSEERAVAAIEAGAFWYIEKPLKGPVLRALLDRALG